MKYIKDKLKEILENPKLIYSLALNKIILITSIFFAYEIYLLPNHPDTFPLSVNQSVLLIIFVVGTSSLFLGSLRNKKHRNNFQKLITAIIFLLISLILLIITSFPKSKTLGKAQIDTNNQIGAIKSGNNLANDLKIKFDINNPNDLKNTADKKEIEQYKDEVDITTDNIKETFKEEVELQEKALDSFEKTLNESKLVDEIIEEEVKPVPFKFNGWACNDNGCSFTDGETIWMIGQSNRIFSSVLIFVNMIILLGIVNDPKREKVKTP